MGDGQGTRNPQDSGGLDDVPRGMQNPPDGRRRDRPASAGGLPVRPARVGSLMALRLLTTLGALIFYAGLLTLVFLVAGTARLPFFWAVLGSQFAIGVTAIFKIDPDLLIERARPGGKDLDPWGRPLLAALLIGQIVLAALDVGRLHLCHVPLVLKLCSLLVQALGWQGFMLALRENRYFSSAIRLQADRGQRVVTTGPYAFVRHPGYVFAALAVLTQGVALGSWLTLVPGVLLTAELIHRTRMEERMLADLEGYSEYARNVPFRWIPGVW